MIPAPTVRALMIPAPTILALMIPAPTVLALTVPEPTVLVPTVPGPGGRGTTIPAQRDHGATDDGAAARFAYNTRMPLPIELIGLGRPELHIVWDEGDESTYPARALRLACRCARCVDEFTGRPLLDPNSVPESVTIAGMRLAGNYGVHIAFSDGHDTGIYRFGDLYSEARRPRP
jgi:ATP-binding protein involved in chromosome partitioning